ncbi:MAG TPA: hypothetical protein VG276_28820 [Actinomycetes bacterium]|jgi:hypothetical protein|nr:hypothetical protein [Actinomycetes bacterium]
MSAHAEAQARDEGLSEAALDVRAVLEAAALLTPEAGEAELAALLFEVYTAELPWWRRLRLAMWGW